VHPAAIADLITRLEDLAVLMWFERPIAADDEHRLVLDIASMRALEAAAALGTLAERLAIGVAAQARLSWSLERLSCRGLRRRVP
jgi:hypothetical protein